MLSGSTISCLSSLVAVAISASSTRASVWSMRVQPPAAWLGRRRPSGPAHVDGGHCSSRAARSTPAREAPPRGVCCDDAAAARRRRGGGAALKFKKVAAKARCRRVLSAALRDAGLRYRPITVRPSNRCDEYTSAALRRQPFFKLGAHAMSLGGQRGTQSSCLSQAGRYAAHRRTPPVPPGRRERGEASRRRPSWHFGAGWTRRGPPRERTKKQRRVRRAREKTKKFNWAARTPQTSRRQADDDHQNRRRDVVQRLVARGEGLRRRAEGRERLS